MLSFLHRFTSTLATNDPLQTFFQLMSGRIPQAAQVCEQQAGPIAHLTHLMITIPLHLHFPLLQSCGDAKWGDWRPHLAVLLSNKVGDMELNHRAIVTMGDTLGEQGHLRKRTEWLGWGLPVSLKAFTATLSVGCCPSGLSSVSFSHPAGKGAVEAAHFCYLMADIPFGYFGVKADRMALLGSSHR